LHIKFPVDLPDETIEHFHILPALSVNNGAFANFNVVYQLVYGFPVKFL